jgi:hypothetical protein
MYENSFEVSVSSKHDFYKVHIEEYTANELMSIEDQNGLEVYMDSNKHSAKPSNRDFYLGMFNTLKIKYPVTPQLAMLSGEIYCRYQDFNMNYNKFTRLLETADFKPKMITGEHYHYTMIGEDDSIWGLGYRVQGEGQSNCKLRKITKPADCVDFKKLTSGKFQRWILTNSGKIFGQG